MGPSSNDTYVLLPAAGVRAARKLELDFLTRFGGARSTLPSLKIAPSDFLNPIASMIPSWTPPMGEPAGDIEVIDSVHEDGPKLVRMTESAALAFELSGAGRAVPLRYYEPARTPLSVPRNAPSRAASTPPIKIQVRERSTGRPVPGVKVVVYTSIEDNEGAAAVTDETGVARLLLGPAPVVAESLAIESPARACWGRYEHGIQLAADQGIDLEDIAYPLSDCVRQRCEPFSVTDGRGVRVAIVDSGVGPHDDISLWGGTNTVMGEPAGDFHDNGMGHGTHVAGIVGGKSADGRYCGIAPAAELWSARIYPGNDRRATNYAITKAIILACDRQCDLINLSLSGEDADPSIQDAIRDACHQGAVVFVAAGNKGEPRVGFPARSEGAVGVSAFGIQGSYPASAGQSAEVGKPDAQETFFASFSNYGPEIRFAGPGVGVVSTALGGGYAVRSGTSMACAAVTGIAARLLSSNSALSNMQRDYARSAAIQNELARRARSLGFGLTYEGSGAL